MSDSPAKRFKRALVSVLLELIRVYGLTMSISRDSSDKMLAGAYRKVMLRAHPDKPGGSPHHAKRLNDAYDNWTQADL